MRFLLALRAIFFVLLLPGTVAGYVPFRILSAADQVRVPELSLSSAGASIVAIAGAVVLLRCVWDFFAKGKGTLAPIDPPRVLGGPVWPNHAVNTDANRRRFAPW